jgi:hypothetical protein
MLYTHAVKRDPGIGIHTLIFSNNASNSAQVFDTFRQGLKEKISLVVLETNGRGEKIIRIRTTEDHMDSSKPFKYSDTDILVSDIKPYKTKIVDGHTYAYQPEQYDTKVCDKRLAG